MPETIRLFSNYVVEFCSSDVKLRRETEISWPGKDNGWQVNLHVQSVLFQVALYTPD